MDEFISPECSENKVGKTFPITVGFPGQVSAIGKHPMKRLPAARGKKNTKQKQERVKNRWVYAEAVLIYASDWFLILAKRCKQ